MSAADLPTDKFTVTGDVTTSDYKDGTFTWTKKNQTDNENKNATAKDPHPQGDIILAKASSSLIIKNLSSLNFKEDLDENGTPKSVDAVLWAKEGADVTIDVGDINFGDKDHVLKADQGFHAYGSTIDVTVDNIYGNVRGSSFLMSQSKGNTNNFHQGALKIHATNHIDLNSNYRGLIGVQSYDQTSGENGASTMEITAGGIIGLHVTGNESNIAAITMKAASWQGGPLEKGGNLSLKIAGDKGVSITNKNGIGVSNVLNIGDNDTNKADIIIESSQGDVNIEANGNAIQSIIKNTDNNDGTSQNTPAKSNINLSGNNVNVVSKTGTAILLDRNTTMTLKANKDNGKIHISGGNVAASVGTGSKLTIGNDINDTTVDLQGRIMVSNGGTVTVADKTTTVVDATSLGKDGLVSIINDGKFEAKGNAKLVVKGANTGTTLYDTTDNHITFWKTTSFDNPFQYLSKDGTVQAGITDANKQSIAGYAASSVGLAATTANDAKLKPLLTNIDSWNSAAGIGQAAGIQHSTYAVTGLFTDALSTHDDTKGKDLWAKGFHSKENIDGLGFAGDALSLDTQYNGTVVGMDIYQNENTTAGVAITYADGNISSSNGGVYTKNDATYVGASLYGLKDLGSYRLAADLSYVGGSHDITQRNAGQVITAKPDTEAWTLGVKAMKDYDLARGTLTPYVGLRYLRLTTDGYTSSVGFSYDKENQNLFLLPVGVDYSLAVKRGSWDIKPYAGLSYIWTMGDRNADQTVSYGSASDVFSYDITDAGSFLGKVGISASKGDYSFGVGYTYQTGNTVDSHTWSVKASYAF